MQAGRPYQRIRWRQIATEENASPERVELEIAQPKAAEIYYDTCSKIDRPNRCRQDDLAIERKLKILEWSQRVNLFSICVVDSWLVYKESTGCSESQHEFYTVLAEELIDNTFDQPVHARRSSSSSSPSAVSQNGFVRAGVGPHLTPTRRKRKKRDGTLTNHVHQGYCVVCSKKTTMVCSVCRGGPEQDGGDSMYVCGSKTTRLCFAIHLQQRHDIT
jgi:hypothetical protein